MENFNNFKSANNKIEEKPDTVLNSESNHIENASKSEVSKESIAEKIKKAIRKSFLISMTAGAALGANAQDYESPENIAKNKDLKTKNKIENTEKPALEKAFPKEEKIQGVSREQFDQIVVEALAKKLRTTKEKLLITSEVQLEILLYERFAKLSQTKRGYVLDIDEKYFNKDGSVNLSYWDEEVGKFVSDLHRKVSGVDAYWKTDLATGEQYVVSPNSESASAVRDTNLGGAKKLVEILLNK
jgi:hypothetical protein